MRPLANACGSDRSHDREGAVFRARSGQAITEFALLYAGVVLPLTFMVVFVAQMLWIWHSVVDFTRDGARYAATHCWQQDGSAGNVLQYMQSHVPAMIDMDQFQTNAAGIQVQYFAEQPDGSLAAFDNGACSGCLPDAVSVSITAYQYKRFSSFFKLPRTHPGRACHEVKKGSLCLIP
jgi:hypothetical protein